MGFDGNGNISQKSDLEAFTLNYSGVRADGSSIGPHALATISGVPVSPFPQNDLTVTYTDFKKISTLDEGAKHYELTYGVDDERRISVYYANGKSQGAPTLTRYYLGDYEEEVNSLGKVRKIHYLSGAILIQNDGKADSLLYTYSDAQGSLIALTDASGNVVEKYAYDPWGAKRNPTDWTQKDLRTKWITNRGYTGHEHLDAFCIINMNGRVYDPLTAQFFSPDSYVQSPGNWLNYNRYTYCSGNPFKYTDPSGDLQIGPFYLSFNIGWSPQGGLSFGISAGVGLENVASVGLSIGYGAKTGNFSFTVNASLGGAYADAGYDTKAGWIGGAGFAAPSPFSIWSPVSISTNLTSVSIGYSQNGGMSGNFYGFDISSSGMSFDPSIGASATYYPFKVVIIHDTNDNIGVVSKDKAKIGTDAQVKDLLHSEGITPSKYHDKIAGMDEQLPQTAIDQGRKRGTDGIVRSSGEVAGGTTLSTYAGFTRSSKTFMSPNNSAYHFTINLAHEFVHSDMWYNWGYKNKRDYDKITEYYAYKVNSMYYNIGIDQSLDNLINFRSYSGNYTYTLPNFPFLK